MKNDSLKIVFIAVLIVVALFFTGCVTTIPLTSNINDFVMMGLKTNKQDAVSLQIVSNVQDGEITVLDKDTKGSTGKVQVSENSVLQNMIRDYMSSKFTKLSDAGSTKITITIKDFSAQDYNTESGGSQFARALIGGAYGAREPRIVSTKITATVDIQRNGKDDTKNLIASAEKNYTGEFTSENGNNTFADCLNSANNKLLMELNAYFEELGM